MYYSSGSFFHGLSAQEPARKRAAVGAPFRFAFLFASDSSWWQHRTGVVGKGLKTFARDQKSIFVSTSRLTPRLFAINLISVFSKRIVAELCQIQRNRFGRAIPNVRYYPFLSECGGESPRQSRPQEPGPCQGRRAAQPAVTPSPPVFIDFFDNEK